MKRYLDTEAATERVGAALGRALGRTHAFVTLCGDLGAGKTALVRAALRALGHDGPVRSPTYTLIESYGFAHGAVHHLDWYRMGDADELELLGFRDWLPPGQSVLVEWPERVPAVAAQADLAIRLAYAGDGRALEASALTAGGAELLQHWESEIG